MKTKTPWKRLRHYLEIAGMTILVSVLLALKNEHGLSRILTDLALNAVFLAAMLYLLESSRIRLKIGTSASNSYGRISLCYFILCILTVCFAFFPAFTYPAASFALFLSMIAGVELSICFCGFLSILLCAAGGSGVYELAAYFLLILIGAQLAETLHERKLRIWGCMILFAVSACLPSLFYYMEYFKRSYSLLLFNGICGVLAVFCYGFFADRLYDRMEHEEFYAYEEIIKDSYPLLKDIKNYSKPEYVHAMKVATIARKCAAEIGANEMAVTAAGFYYRLGMLEGEPFIENGVRLAKENCFPQLVIQILSEYNGEENLPSSKESAIVHMVDACVKRIEFLTAQSLSSSWNQDMVIYQTLNELSGSGIYDKSGMSMNQFLKIRELLVREEIGYDSDH